MHIGMVCPYSLAVWGGVQAQVLGLSRVLREKGVDVQILAPCDGPPPVPWVTPLGDSIPYAENGSLAPLAPDPPAQLRMLGAVRENRFDLLHLHEPFAPGPTLTSVLVKTVPLVGTFHVSGDVPAYRWFKPLAHRLARRIDCKVAVSSEAAGMAQRHLGGKYEIFFNGVEYQKFAHAEKMEREKCQTIFFVGRHEPRKGLSVLLEACKQLPPNLKIWIAGIGPETKRLRTTYGDDGRIVWLGALNEEEKLRRLKSADVFCVPSLGGESFGVVLLEAMAAGTPVVASDLPAYKDVSGNGKYASLFSTGDSDALAKAIREILDGDVALADRVAFASERAAEFSMSRLADLYIHRYQSVLEKKS